MTHVAARRSLVPAFVIAALLALASPAAAHFELFGYSLFPEITPSGAEVRFSVDCTAGETYKIQVKISQGPTSTSATGVATGPCTGELQSFQVPTAYIGRAGNRFKPGAGTMGFRAWTFSGGTTHSSTGTVVNEVTLRDNE